MSITVTQLLRYPVKSMGGHALDAAALNKKGIPGDRAWTLKDEERGGIKGGKRFPQLMGMRAAFVSEPTAAVSSPEVRITLNNGDTIDADAVLSAVGVRPRTALAAEAGLAVGRGIQTNQKLEASAPNVYALGDCAEVAGHVLVYVAPLMAGARALAKTLTGEPTDVVYPPMPVTIKTPACAVNVSPAPHGASGSWEISGTAPDITALFKSPDGDLLGFALTGEAVRERPGYTKQLPDILS